MKTYTDIKISCTIGLIHFLLAVGCLWANSCASGKDNIEPEDTQGFCSDREDNDKDGLMDCRDPECAKFCIESCADRKDNDQDGKTDCEDADCTDACVEICSDHIDNDQDGSTDCEDTDCTDACVEICNDHIDNDQDGSTDCEDTDCKDSCTEKCYDHIDNDNDSLTDCDDTEDCPGPCFEKCTDMKDNDFDGTTDCDDIDCVAEPSCPFVPDCEDSSSCKAKEKCIDNVCRSITGHLLCWAPAHALVLLDWRLYERVYWPLYRYLRAACQRRSFGIEVMGVEGIDDMSFEQVKEIVVQQYLANPALQGVLFVGNIAMPTFFMGRMDEPFVRFWPRYYQDLDMVMDKTIPDGMALPICDDGPKDEDGYPSNWPCFTPNWFIAPFVVPQHDFDHFEQGPQYGTELWTSFLPVGFPDPGLNTYDHWAEQLIPFFEKALYFYEHRSDFFPHHYHVGNDPTNLKDIGQLWDLIGGENIDYYSLNVWGEGYCIDNPECYQRAPTEDYASLEDFLSYAQSLPWMDEGWQSPDVFLSHLNNHPHFPRMTVFWAVHSSPTKSIITTTEARTQIKPGQGGVLALPSGCLVGTYKQPGRLLPEDRYGVPYPERNLLVSLVYGPSSFISAVGAITPRTTHPLFGTLINGVYIEDYLGMGDKRRSDAQDRETDLPYGYRQHWEILIGDPFLDAR